MNSINSINSIDEFGDEYRVILNYGFHEIKQSYCFFISNIYEIDNGEKTHPDTFFYGFPSELSAFQAGTAFFEGWKQKNLKDILK